MLGGSSSTDRVSPMSINCPALFHALAIPFLALPGSTMLRSDTGCGNASAEIVPYCHIGALYFPPPDGRGGNGGGGGEPVYLGFWRR